MRQINGREKTEHFEISNNRQLCNKRFPQVRCTLIDLIDIIEKELGKNPIIASVSFGSDRFFHLKHREQKELRFKILLKSGSLFFMEGETQTHWLHQIAKTSQPVGTRLNLTFRRFI